MNKRAATLLALVPIAVLVLAPPFGSPAFGDSGPSFSGIASATGVDAIISNESIPLGISPEFSGPAAQASLSSLGDSNAQAAFPDLGSTVNGVPGLAGALLGGLPVPAYPLMAASDTSTPHATSAAPGIALSAQSQAGSSEGRAVVGSEGTGFTSTAQVAVQADQSVVAEASTTFGINLLNLVSISGVQSSASVKADANTGELTRTSSISIGRISIPGLSVALPKETPSYIPIPIPIPGIPQLPPLNLPALPIPLGGTTLPIPDLGFEDGTFTVTVPVLGNGLRFTIPAGLVLTALDALGIHVTYQTAQNTSTGVIAPALTLSFTAPALPKNDYFNGPTEVSFTLGQAKASVTLHPAFNTGGSGTGSGGGTVTGTGTGSSPGSGTGTVSSNGGSPAGVLPIAGSLGPTLSSPSGSASATTPLVAGAQPHATGPSLIPVAMVDQSQADLSSIYLIVVGAAALAFAAASILRLVGVRLLWGS